MRSGAGLDDIESGLSTLKGGNMILSTVRRNIKRSKKFESKINNSQEMIRFEKTTIQRGKI